MCAPTWHIFSRGTAAEKKAAGVDAFETYQDLVLSRIYRDSPFPCEEVEYIELSCLDPNNAARDTKGKVSREVIEAERACVCNTKIWEFSEACRKCVGIHGYSHEDADRGIEIIRLEEKRFCNTTVPELNLYWLQREIWGEENYVPPSPTTWAEMPFPSRTEVSFYYTSGVRTTIGDTWAPGSAMTEAMDSTGMDPTSTGEAFTRASTFDATRTGVPDSPLSTSSAGAAAGREVKAAGGILVAIIDAIIML